jgi:hypothetical protein
VVARVDDGSVCGATASIGADDEGAFLAPHANGSTSYANHQFHMLSNTQAGRQWQWIGDVLLIDVSG